MRKLFSALLILVGFGAHAETPVVNVGVLKFGTVNWLMETIEANRLDDAAGYKLQVVPLAGKPATTIAFQSGDVDVIVSDWVWAMRQRWQGADYLFFPYSRSLGSLMAGPGVELKGICDLQGRPLGVVGGPLDKSWLVLQALVARDCGFDLVAETQTLFGAPPLMSRQLETGGVDAVLTYWHYAARLTALEATPVITIAEAIEDLGIAPAPPLVGFIWDAAHTDADAIAKFRKSVDAASEILLTSDEAWEILRPQMRLQSDTEFILLRDAYRQGVTTRWTSADTDAARELHDVMTEAGGDAFIQSAGKFEPSVFEGSDG
ncbi:ABC transporter substrate-binding protein [Rhodobacteraceae bacterium NNCM2]|nr:ABC transporter substrate-binding protein [Coraliihabitans acroporae]